MAITKEDLIEFYPPAADLPDSVIDRVLCVVNEQEQCLIDCGLSECMIELILLNAAAYLLAVANPVFGFKSNRSPTGESFTNFDNGGEIGLSSNLYGRQVLALDACGCLVDTLENPQNQRFIVTVGETGESC